MRKTEIIFKRNTNFMLHGYVWKPECKPVGVIPVSYTHLTLPTIA